MAQFRSTADLLDSILRRAGEPTNGNSDLESDALEYLNRIHTSIIAGGDEFDVNINEPWIWARSERPLILELQPKYETGTVSLTLGSEVGAFSAAPTLSYEGWFLRVNGKQEVFRIAQHTAASAAFEIGGLYPDATNATASYELVKLDYELVSSHIIIDALNCKIDFEEVATTEITATLVAGVYTPADLATQVATKLNAAGTAAYTCTYSAATRKFTLGSDLAGPVIFKLLAQSGTNQANSALLTLGYDIVDQATAASHVSTYMLNPIARLIEPFRIDKGANRDGNIDSVDAITLQKDYPFADLREGYPTRFAIIREDKDGKIIARFNMFPKEKTKIEIEHIPMPIDLKDNAQSFPAIPRKYSSLLEFGAAFYLLMDKEDSKAQGFAQLASAKLKAMSKENRLALTRSSRRFGEIIPRPDLDNSRRRIFNLIDPEGN